MKYWVFDLDGTLVDSFAPYFAFLEKRFGHPLNSEERKHLVGISVPEVFKLKLPSAEVQQAIADLQADSLISALNTVEFAKISSVINHLKGQGKEVAVFTNRGLASAKKLIEISPFAHQISHIVSGECVKNPKPNPEGLQKLQLLFNCREDEMVMVGDHEHDIHAGLKHGAFTVRASWHGHWDDGLCALSHKQFHSTDDFHNWIRGL